MTPCPASVGLASRIGTLQWLLPMPRGNLWMSSSTLQSEETERIGIESERINRNVSLVSAEAAATTPLSPKC